MTSRASKFDEDVPAPVLPPTASRTTNAVGGVLVGRTAASTGSAEKTPLPQDSWRWWDGHFGGSATAGAGSFRVLGQHQREIQYSAVHVELPAGPARPATMPAVVGVGRATVRALKRRCRQACRTMWTKWARFRSSAPSKCEPDCGPGAEIVHARGVDEDGWTHYQLASVES